MSLSDVKKLIKLQFLLFCFVFFTSWIVNEFLNHILEKVRFVKPEYHLSMKGIRKRYRSYIGGILTLVSRLPRVIG